VERQEPLAEAVRGFSDADACERQVVELRWPDGAVSCPRCGSSRVGRIRSRGLFQCKETGCRGQFSARAGTLFEESALGLEKWFVAAWCVGCAGDRVRSTDLSRALGITQKSAWNMLHKIRLATKAASFVASEAPGDEIEPFVRALLRVPKSEIEHERALWRARPRRPAKPPPWSLEEFAVTQRSPELVLEVGALLRAKSPSGDRTCVPVMGSGINIQAANMEGFGARDDWQALLGKVAESIGMSKRKLPTAPLSLWEALLCRWGERRRVFPFEAERELQNFVCQELRKQEDETSWFGLYKKISQAGFADIISLNFDRRIGLSAKRRHRSVGAPSGNSYGLFGESLFRHSTVRRLGGGTTRIWYPHGDTKKAISVKLGTRRYGFYIGLIEERLGGGSSEWRFKPEEGRTVPSRAPTKADSWLEIFLQRPLVFVGCGLSAEEWPLWWLLRKRGTRKRTPPVFLLTFEAALEQAPEQLSLLPELRSVVFSSPGELWTFFLECIEVA
jgi:transposase-like protein